MEKELSSQRKETLLFLSNNMAAMTSDARQYFTQDFFLKLVHGFLDNVYPRSKYYFLLF